MPPKTRSSTRRQSTLAFNPTKTTGARCITKPTAPTPKAHAKHPAAKPPRSPDRTTTAENPARTPPTPEQKARSLTPHDISAYYTHRILLARRHPPLHQAELPIEEKILRHFDLSSQYGPCAGMARTERWWRAERLGLRPPVEVLAVAMEVGEREAGRAGEGGARTGRDRRRAYVHDFLACRTAGEEGG